MQRAVPKKSKPTLGASEGDLVDTSAIFDEPDWPSSGLRCLFLVFEEVAEVGKEIVREDSDFSADDSALFASDSGASLP